MIDVAETAHVRQRVTRVSTAPLPCKVSLRNVEDLTDGMCKCFELWKGRSG